MKIALFLGAGASVFAGVPTMEELSEILYKQLSRDGRSAPKILHGLFEKTSIKNIEDVYASLESLHKIEKTNAYVLLKNLTLHTEEHGYKETTRIERDTDVLPYPLPLLPDMAPSLRNVPKKTVVERTPIRQTPPPFSKLVETAAHTTMVIRDVLNENVIADDTKDSVIKNTYDEILDILPDDTPILTTNYDNIIERYCEQVNQPTIQGFVWNGHANVWKNRWSGKGRILVKIHGSLLWRRDGDKIKAYDTKAERNMSDDVMIYPTQSAKTYKRTPFSELFLQAKKVLENTDLLIVIGFSFRDNEINKIICKHLSRGMKMIVFDKDAASVGEHFKGFRVGDAIDGNIVTRNLDFTNGDLGAAIRTTVKMINGLPE